VPRGGGTNLSGGTVPVKGGVIIEINKTAADALGHHAPDLIGKSIKRLIHPDDHGIFDQHHASLTENGLPQDYELRLRRSNGETLIVSLKSEPLSDRHRALAVMKVIRVRVS